MTSLWWHPTHCGLVTPYGVTGLIQLCFRYSLLSDGMKQLPEWRLIMMSLPRWWLIISRVQLQWRHNGLDGVSNHQPRHCLLSRLFRRRSKKTSKLRVSGLCAWNSPETGEFPAQRTSYAENVSIWWRHHAVAFCAHHSLQGNSKELLTKAITTLHLTTYTFKDQIHISWRQRVNERAQCIFGGYMSIVYYLCHY